MESDDETFSNGYDTEDEFNLENESESDGDINESHSEEYPYEVLSIKEIVRYMKSIVKEVNTVVTMPATTIRILLNHFKWDKDKLIEKYYDGDQEKLFEEAHIINPFIEKLKISSNESSQDSSPNENSSDEMDLDCEICYLTLPPSMMTGLECGHNFCKCCWNEYLSSKIIDEGVSQTIACAAPSCDILVDDATVMSLVKDSKVRLKYQHLIIKSFVECNRHLRWCTTPGCRNVFKVQYVAFKPVTCTCNHTICFQCGEDWHDPLPCKLMKNWLKKFVDDIETKNWLKANTKDCPKCGTSIEKNGGCNHMVCKNLSCNTEFCWLCFTLWHLHSANGYKCNVFDEERAMTAEVAKIALQRFEFYSNRYLNHFESLKLENNLYDIVEAKMEKIQRRYKKTWIEVQYLVTAVEILHSCRQTLMYTYAFAYYVKKNNQLSIFEANQNDLENATEYLSGYLERDLTGKIDIEDLKRIVQDKSNYCESRRQALLKHVHEGSDNALWEYIEE